MIYVVCSWVLLNRTLLGESTLSGSVCRKEMATFKNQIWSFLGTDEMEQKSTEKNMFWFRGEKLGAGYYNYWRAWWKYWRRDVTFIDSCKDGGVGNKFCAIKSW